MNLVIRTHQGLGDAVYSYPIIEHYTKTHKITVKTNYPIIFDALNVHTVDLKNKTPFDIFPKYTNIKTGESQYQIMLQSVNLPHIPFNFKWNFGFTEEFKNNQFKKFLHPWIKSKKKLCIIKEPCTAHVHKISKDFSFTPIIEDYQEWIIKNQDDYYTASVGMNEIFKKRLIGIDCDLNNKTSVQDLITLCSMANIICTQIGHLVPIAQGLNKPLKIFYPEKITDRRYQHINKKSMELK